MSSSLSIGSLPRASARLTTTLSIAVLAHDRRNVLDRADDARVEQRRADARRVGIDEADDLDAEIRRWCSSRASSIAGVARADEQQPLARPDANGQPGKAHPPADDRQGDEHRGDRDDAAAEDQRGKPEIEDRQDQRRGAERLQNPNQQLAAIARAGDRRTNRSSRGTTGRRR